MTTRERALEYLYRELKKAKIALGQAETRSGVTHEELENLRNKIDAIDYLIPLAIVKEDVT